MGSQRVGHGWVNSTFTFWKLNMKKEVIQVENECMIWKGISLKTICRLDFSSYFKCYMFIQPGYPVPFLSWPQLSDGQPKGKEGLNPRGAPCSLPSVPGLQPVIFLAPHLSWSHSRGSEHPLLWLMISRSQIMTIILSILPALLSLFILTHEVTSWPQRSPAMGMTVCSEDADARQVEEEWVRSCRHAVKIQPVPPARPSWVLPTYCVVFQVILLFLQNVFNEMILD